MSEDGVTYSFKDLFDKFDHSLSEGFKRLDGRLDEINRKIDGKADNSRVAALESTHAKFEVKIEERFGKIDDRFKPLELAQGASAAVTMFQRWLIGTVAVGILGSIATLVWLASGGH